nr:MAG TPA: hypothetical protein [Caudoviricetes sp.]
MLLVTEKLCYPNKSSCGYNANNDTPPLILWGGF